MAKGRMCVESSVCVGKSMCGSVFVFNMNYMNDMTLGQERRNKHDCHEVLRTSHFK
jgi:hypothetical protein